MPRSYSDTMKASRCSGVSWVMVVGSRRSTRNASSWAIAALYARRVAGVRRSAARWRMNERRRWSRSLSSAPRLVVAAGIVIGLLQLSTLRALC
jgi:hypothetical protein